MVNIVRTQPRELCVAYIRSGDEIAFCPMPAKHLPGEVCDCPPPAGQRRPTSSPVGQGTDRWHCAGRHTFARTVEFVDHNPEAILWLLVVEPPQLIEPPAGSPCPDDQYHVGMRQFVCTPIRAQRLSFPIKVDADALQQLVIRERVQTAEGQPMPSAGITATRAVPSLPGYRCPKLETHTPPHAWKDEKHVGTATMYWCDGRPDNVVPLSSVTTTRVLSTSRIPVGVQGVQLGGDHPHYASTHDDSRAVDFRSERDSE